jgi:hypothetical protein
MATLVPLSIACSPLLLLLVVVALEIGPTLHREVLAGLRGLSENMAFVGGAGFTALGLIPEADGVATGAAQKTGNGTGEIVVGIGVFVFFVFVSLLLSLVLKRRDELDQLLWEYHVLEMSDGMQQLLASVPAREEAP